MSGYGTEWNTNTSIADKPQDSGSPRHRETSRPSTLTSDLEDESYREELRDDERDIAGNLKCFKIYERRL